jgi:hypothetical protein
MDILGHIHTINEKSLTTIYTIVREVYNHTALLQAFKKIAGIQKINSKSGNMVFILLG